jgi:hypothetical protein
LGLTRRVGDRLSVDRPDVRRRLAADHRSGLRVNRQEIVPGEGGDPPAFLSDLIMCRGPYDAPIQLSRKNQRSSPTRPFLRASARHAFSFAPFWRHLASRSLKRPFAGAAFEWAGMLAPLSFWACDCTTGAMASNKANGATMTMTGRVMNSSPQPAATWCSCQ